MPTARDQKNRSTTSAHIPAATIATNTTTNPSAGLDTKDANAVTFDVFSGARTDGTFTPNIQESDDDSTWTEVDANNIIGAETAITAANTVVSIGVHPKKRYVRCQLVSTGASSGAVVGVNARVYTS